MTFKTKPNLYSTIYFNAPYSQFTHYGGTAYYSRSLEFERNFRSCAETGALINIALNEAVCVKNIEFKFAFLRMRRFAPL